MERNSQHPDEYLADWPAHYYELSPDKRLAALKELLRHDPDSADDLRRSELFQKRYDASFKDLFLQAWMMLKAADAQPSGFLMKRKFEQDVRKEFERLCIHTDSEPDPVLKEEWVNFADSLIRMYLSSPSYRAAVFGMGAVNERNTALRLRCSLSGLSFWNGSVCLCRTVKQFFTRFSPDSFSHYRSLLSDTADGYICRF